MSTIMQQMVTSQVGNIQSKIQICKVINFLHLGTLYLVSNGKLLGICHTIFDFVPGLGKRKPMSQFIHHFKQVSMKISDNKQPKIEWPWVVQGSL